MKSLFAAMIVLLSPYANAEGVNAYLKVSRSNGTVNPMYRNSVSCMIASDGKVHVNKRTGDIMRTSEKKIAWGKVRNETVLKSLIHEASRGEVIDRKGPIPVGAARTEYTGFVSNTKTFKLKLQFGGVLSSINRSEAAARLIELLDLNCASVIK